VTRSLPQVTNFLSSGITTGKRYLHEKPLKITVQKDSITPSGGLDWQEKSARQMEPRGEKPKKNGGTRKLEDFEEMELSGEKGAKT